MQAGYFKSVPRTQDTGHTDVSEAVAVLENPPSSWKAEASATLWGTQYLHLLGGGLGWGQLQAVRELSCTSGRIATWLQVPWVPPTLLPSGHRALVDAHSCTSCFQKVKMA